MSFSTDANHYLRLSILNGNGEITVHGKRQITGEEEFAGMKAYMYAEISSDVVEEKYVNDTAKETLIVDVGNSKKNSLISIWLVLY